MWRLLLLYLICGIGPFGSRRCKHALLSDEAFLTITSNGQCRLKQLAAATTWNFSHFMFLNHIRRLAGTCKRTYPKWDAKFSDQSRPSICSLSTLPLSTALFARVEKPRPNSMIYCCPRKQFVTSSFEYWKSKWCQKKMRINIPCIALSMLLIHGYNRIVDSFSYRNFRTNSWSTNKSYKCKCRNFLRLYILPQGSQQSQLVQYYFYKHCFQGSCLEQLFRINSYKLLVRYGPISLQSQTPLMWLNFHLHSQKGRGL